MFRRHYTDEQLLSLLDDQPDGRLIVSNHLQSCWKCRSRLAEVEDQFRALTSSWREAALTPPAGVEEARRRFLAWTSAGTFQFQRRNPRPATFAALLRAPVIAGAGAILLLGGVSVWKRQLHENPEPAKMRVTMDVAPRLDPPAPPVKAIARVAHPVGRVEPPRPAALLSGSRLLDAEVEVWWLLHRAGACAGEPVEIKRTHDFRILIGGMVLTRRRRQELTTALEGIADHDLIRIELEAAEDLQTPRRAALLVGAAPRSGLPIAPSEFQLAAAFALRGLYPADTDVQTRARLVEMSNRAIRRSEDASGESMAIRRLGNRFPGNATLDLSPRSRQLLELMAREHLLALRTHVAEIGSLLAPILSSETSEPAVLASPLDLTAAVERLRALVQGSLSGNPSSLGAPAQVRREIAALNEHLTLELSDVDSTVARVF